jgi:hypothetical protein
MIWIKYRHKFSSGPSEWSYREVSSYQDKEALNKAVEILLEEIKYLKENCKEG